MTFGVYDHFKADKIQRLETYSSTLPTKQLQQKLIRTLRKINQQNFCFEEVSSPTVAGGKVFFEFGLADGAEFNFIDDEEVERVIDALEKNDFALMDFYCVIRYSKESGKTKKVLKFDYYMLRTSFGKDTFEVMVFHERGPRYVSPEDLAAVIEEKLNGNSSKKVLKLIQPP